MADSVVALITLAPVMLPPEPPPEMMLPPEILAVVVTLLVELIADTTFELRLNPAAFRLPPVTFPVTLTLVPVAAPMLGVVRLALALTEIFPPPSNAVVVPSTLAENTVPVRDKPAEVLAVYV